MRLYVGINAFLILLFLSSCNSESKKQPDSRTVFRYNEAPGISSLDPAFARGQADIWACNQLYNGLLQLNDKLEPVPCIAKSWDISSDGLTYTFHLRSDVSFHRDLNFGPSGTRKVIASDFVYSFRRILDPATASPGFWVFNHVATDKATGAPLFTALDDTTLTIQLTTAFPPFPGLITSQYCAVVPWEIVTHYGSDFRKHPVGTGPFMFKFWEERTALVFHRNPDYFEFENGHQLPFIDAVSISFISDRQSAFLEFLKGNLDFVSGIDASYKDDLLTRTGVLRPRYQGRFKMLTGPYLNTEYLGMLIGKNSQQGGPLSDVRIRKAINLGFDRVKMITYLRNGIGTPGIYGMVPPGLPSFDSSDANGYTFNPSEAKRLLAEAGFPNGKGMPEITLATTKEYQDLCEYIQGELARLGITIRLEVNQGAAHREMVAKQKLAFFRGSWIADYADAENYLSLFYSPNQAPAGPNYTYYNSPAFDNLYRQASRTVNDSVRYRLYREMDNLVMEDAPVVVLYYDQVVRLCSNETEGLGMNAMNLLSLKRVRKIKTKN